MHIDLFCQVVDNYGDIGVCWRLAQQLQPHCQLRLFVDDLEAFQRIEPNVNPDAPVQQIQNTQVLEWTGALTTQPATIVIEAFGCELPPAYLAQLPLYTKLWINLEYLSAESWVENMHTLPSPQGNGVSKYFFFPGFTPKTGGLLRPQKKTSTQLDIRFWQQLGLNQAPTTDRVAFVFPYPQAPLNTLYQCLEKDTHSWTVLLAATAPTPKLPSTSPLRIHQLPFIAQSQFDSLLDYADLNLVRGEDSFVRAIWAQKPFIWQPYLQTENTHLEKLRAWLARTHFDTTIQELILHWNTGTVTTSELQLALQNLDSWCLQTEHYAQSLSQQTDLATQLLAFCSQTVQKTVK